MTFSGTHVGDLAAALVDDQLDPPARDAVLAHLVGCPRCHGEVEQQRLLKSRLGALRTPGLPADLARRLSSLHSPDEPSAGLGVEGPRLASAAVLGADAVAARPGQLSFLRDAHRGRRLLVGAASLLLVGAGAAFAAATDAGSASPSQPASSVFTDTSTVARTSSAATGGQPAPLPSSAPLNDPAYRAMTASYGR